jgi:hypothetical protein
VTARLTRHKAASATLTMCMAHLPKSILLASSLLLALLAPACEGTSDTGPGEPIETCSSGAPTRTGSGDLVMGSDGERIGFAVGGSADDCVDQDAGPAD